MNGVTVRRSMRASTALVTISLLAWCFGLWIQPALAESEEPFRQPADIRETLVKIYTVTQLPNYYSPWKMGRSETVSGSGAIIAGNRILTNAHVIADHTFIQVRRYGQARRYLARVAQVSHDVDLALLTVDDKSFFAGVTPLALGKLPEPQQGVTVYGFPFGGDTLSITQGILSRIEHQRYTHSGQSFLAGQIDAAINPGNSGGPVLRQERLVGVVMQAHNPKNAENMGHMVPVSVVRHFLRDIADGSYDGFPSLGVVTQSLENPAMKRRYGLRGSQTGVVVQKVELASSAVGHIQPGDVLMAIEGQPIADDGTVAFRPRERTRFTYYVEQRQIGEAVTLQRMRHGTIETVNVPLAQSQDAFHLVSQQVYDQLPRYFIYGGIVFSPLTTNLLKCWGKDWRRDAPQELLMELNNEPRRDRREVVVALQVLPAEVNLGYHHVRNWVITTVNGKMVRDFAAFVEQVVASPDPVMVLRNRQGFEMVIDRELAHQSHRHVLRRYHIQADRSADLQAVLTSDNDTSEPAIPGADPRPVAIQSRAAGIR